MVRWGVGSQRVSPLPQRSLHSQLLMAPIRGPTGKFISKEQQELTAIQTALLQHRRVPRTVDHRTRANGRFQQQLRPPHSGAEATSDPSHACAHALILKLSQSLTRAFIKTRLPSRVYCGLADLIEFVPLNARGLPVWDVRKHGQLFQRWRVVDADYLKFSAGVGDPSPYELFFEDSTTASQRKRQAQDAIEAFRAVCVRLDLTSPDRSHSTMPGHGRTGIKTNTTGPSRQSQRMGAPSPVRPQLCPF
jgi:hypothetical protein